MDKLLLLISASIVKNTKGHVSLSYPKARKYDLDFLDNFRTSGDCGMNPGTDKTVLEAGALVNVTWHLGYPHRGGYKLEFFNNGKSTLLIPGGDDGGWQFTAREQQHHLVTVPDMPCNNCYIRMQRQAAEWGEKYRFRTCADIAIVPRGEYVEDCNGHGTPTTTAGSVCSCERMYHGSRCQYMSGCTSDVDCNGPKGQGQCIQIDNAVFPER